LRAIALKWSIDLWPWLLVGIIGLIGIFGGWWLWWRLPKRQANRLRLTIRDAKARADVEDSFRKTIGQLLGGAAVLLGAGFAYLQFQQQQLSLQQQQRSTHDLLISTQVSKGFEQLGSGDVMVRLGGIYALEGVMNTSEQYHGPVVEALCAFVREHTNVERRLGPPPADKQDVPPATDIQAVLTVIGRRATKWPDRPDLRNAHLSNADLRIANLSGAYLYHANLSGADLFGANLSGALLMATNLSGAYLRNTNLSGAYLFNADLRGADLFRANLSGAFLVYVSLSGADLSGAKLNDANLTGAKLSGALNLTQPQLDKASCGTDATLPEGLTLKPCPDAK
jgi:hypothetical protein